MECYFCGKETNKVYSPDIDIKGIPFCGDDKCGIELYVLLHKKYK